MRCVMNCVGLFLWVFALGGTLMAQPSPPREIAGYRLGTHIRDYGGRIAPDGVYAVRLRPYLREAPVSVPEGFASGYVIYGTCDAPGTIVRIKVKYEDDSRVFFDRLLDTIKKEYGAPARYVGDPFQAYVAWRWSFEMTKGERIIMILSHYDGDDEEHTQGNAIKLTLQTHVVRESQCYEAQREEAQRRERRTSTSRRALEHTKDPEAWRRYVPRP